MFVQQSFHQPTHIQKSADATPEQGDGDAGADNTLEDAARDGREHARERLREELKRDPTEDEINEWLRQQTEGY
ncbi:MAG TPA: hypothetical protein VEX60_11495 [Pyrinomonadaceae bacterium]|nr:hypothetical protein [Pyrinomonadaceae bacterium]